MGLALESMIVRGEFIEECVWASHGKIYLLSTASQTYKDLTIIKKNKNAKLADGGYYHSAGNILSVFRFEGIYHHTYLSIKHTAVTITSVAKPIPSGYGWNSRRNKVDVVVDNFNTHAEVYMNSGSKPSYVYTEFRLDSDGNVTKTPHMHVRKSHFKDLVPYTEDVLDQMVDVVFKPLAYTNDYSHYSTDSNLIMLNAPGSHHGFFKSKDEAKDFDYNDIVKLSSVNTNHYDKIDVSGNFSNRQHDNYYSYYSYVVSLSPTVKRTYTIVDHR